MASVSKYEPTRYALDDAGQRVPHPDKPGRFLTEKTGETVWRARYRDDAGKEYARHFPRKIDAQRWLDEITTAVGSGTYVAPAKAKMTVGQWCDEWLTGYAPPKPSTIRQAKVHIALIREAFGDQPIRSVKASQVKQWTARMAADGRAASYIYAAYRRLAQLYSAAIEDGVATSSPCTRKSAPPAGKRREYVATLDQVWALHDAFPEHLRSAVLLGAFAGLRLSEAVALRPCDVDFVRGTIRPAIQYPSQALKNDASKQPVPIPGDLSLLLSAAYARAADLAGERAATIVHDEMGRPSSPWAVERAMRNVRGKVADLPEGFRFHDLRHWYGSHLIDQGLPVTGVAACMRHSSANTTMRVYAHKFPAQDDAARAAIGDAIAARAALADSVRTETA